MDPPCSRATVPADMSTVRAPSTARSTPFRSSVRSSRASHCPLAWPSATYRNPGWWTCMPVGSTTVTWTSRFSSCESRFAARVPPTPPPRTTTSAGIGRSPGLPDHEPPVAILLDDLHQLVAGLGHPGGDVGGRALVRRQHLDDVADLPRPDRPDQGHQRAGAGHAARVDGLRDGGGAHVDQPPRGASEDGDGAGGVGHEGGHALDVVDQRVQIVLRDVGQLHRERAGGDPHLADRPGLLEQVRPVQLAPLGRAGHGRDALRARLGGRAVVLADLVGAERVEGPVLEQDVDLAAHGRPAHREHRRGRELVVGPREQDQGKRVVHAGLLLHGASVAPLASRYWGREARTLGAEGPIYPGGYGMRQWPLTCTDEEDWD